MAKKRFRGERKRNPHPVPLPRRGGVVTSRERRKKGNVVTENQKKPPRSHKLHSHRLPFKGGN